VPFHKFTIIILIIKLILLEEKSGEASELSKCNFSARYTGKLDRNVMSHFIVSQEAKFARKAHQSNNPKLFQFPQLYST